MKMRTSWLAMLLLACNALSAFGGTPDPLPCATLVYSLPGAEYIHKLPTHAGDSIAGVDFGEITTLELRTDRLHRGNHYQYVYGTAPETEGEFSYVVRLVGADGKTSQARVRLIVSSRLQSPTPMMGWLTWNWFARSISHDKMVEIAEGMKRRGVIDAGYSTIVLDDTWAKPTEAKDSLTYDPAKFPQGVSGLKTALRAIDPRLKVGIYSDAGLMTCESYQPGSYGYEQQHLALFDSWGVDMLKYDFCNSEGEAMESYRRMGEAVANLNERREEAGAIPFVLNICEWGKHQPWRWGAEAGGSSWRATSDMREDWVGDASLPGVLGGVDAVRQWWMYAGVNRFNDLDMMCIGLHGLGGPSNYTLGHPANGGRIAGLTDAQARTQMSLWCMFASPLSLTCDFRDTPKGEANPDEELPLPLLTKADIETLTNREMIAINQDGLGQQAEYMRLLSTGTDYSATGYDVYLKDLAGGRFALSVTNRGSSTLAAVSLPLSELYMEPGRPYLCREVWSGEEQTIANVLVTDVLEAYQTKVYVLTPAR